MTDGAPIDVVLSRLAGVTSSGDSGRQWTARCPAHEDARRSLGVGVTRDGIVLLKCYAGCPTPAVVTALKLEMRNLFPGHKEKPPPVGISVLALAFDKRLPVEFLRECGLTDATFGRTRRVLIPYRDEAGQVLFNRVRFALRAKEGSRQPKGMKLQAYGRERLPGYRQAGRVLILVEGESDAWTLWYHGYPALGVPGADAVKGVTASDLEGFDTIYVWQDGKTKPGDVSGEHFVGRMAARIAGLRPGATVRVLSAAEAKDPNEIQQKLGNGFKVRFDAILAAATAPPAPPSPSLPGAGSPDWNVIALTDMGNARRLVARHGKDLRYCQPEDRWYAWDGGRWRPDETLEIDRRAKSTVAAIYAEAKAAGSQAEKEAISRWAVVSQSARLLTAMVKLARSEGPIPITPEQLDADPWVLNCPNGVLDLKTGTLRSHRREDHLTKLCPVAYDPAATCPEWERFLSRVFSQAPADPADTGDLELIGYVRRLFGYCLTGDVSTQIVPILWGSGANGKSTLLKVIRDVMGKDYSTKAPRGLFMARRHEQHSAELLTLRGTRLMVATETGQDGRLNEELIKDLTGGEDIQARGMRENFGRPFDPTCKIMLCTNHQPRIPEGGDGTWRRLTLLPFRTRFWDPDRDDPGPEHLKQDKTLAARLRPEYPGVLAWLVRGCLEWQQTGLRAPPTVREQTQAYREDEDWGARFLTECCVVSSIAGDTFLKDVYARYVEWTEQNGGRPVSNRKLKAALVAHNVVVKNGSGNQVTCFGLALAKAGNEGRTLEDFD
ncbi:MAG: phage/plasmid primase, family [Gemmataceae bacterium]|nr:phage/plasmid primase, family [Gemmataceae bacterium]